MTDDISVPSLNKAAIVNTLARRLGFTDYLELATPSTGKHFSEIDPTVLKNTCRMMYITPYVFNDGAKIDFRSPDEDLFTPIEAFRAAGGKAQICLVDGWHTYATTTRDLNRMFGIIPDGGVLVVHDCLPPSRESATPRHRRGEWCGVAYKAYLDFVFQRANTDYFTVDCDYGCGIIVKNRKISDLLVDGASASAIPARPTADLIARSLENKTDFDAAYDLFDQNKTEMMRMISAETFHDLFGPCA